MRIKYDPTADALYITLRQRKVRGTVARRNGYLVDLDKDGDIVGIEILSWSEKARLVAAKSALPAHAVSA